MARVSAYWHIPAYIQTNSTNCTIKYLIHFGLINTPNGALRASPPPPISIAASYSSYTKSYFQKQNAFIQTQTLAARGEYLSTGPTRL
jgi:hypothetical protein